MPKRWPAAASLALGVLGYPLVYFAYFWFAAVHPPDLDAYRAFALSAVGQLAGLTAVGMAGAAVALGLVSWLAARGRPREAGLRSLATDGLVAGLVMLCCNLALFAELRDQRARVISAQETSEVAVMKDIVDAEGYYARSNGGQFDTLECVAQPCRCMPHCDAAKVAAWPEYRAAWHLEPGRSPYRETFYPGPAPVGVDPARHSLSSLTSFAVVAAPIARRSGLRLLCADSERATCVLPRRSALDAIAGRCPASCVPWKPEHEGTR